MERGLGPRRVGRYDIAKVNDQKIDHWGERETGRGLTEMIFSLHASPATRPMTLAAASNNFCSAAS